MKRKLSRLGAVPGALLALLALVTTGVMNPTAVSAHEVPAWTSGSGTVLQTNLVSDLPGVAATTDPNLVNAWGISESSGSPFWISDNNSGLTTLYKVLHQHVDHYQPVGGEHPDAGQPDWRYTDGDGVQHRSF